jgi:hypothetical protein
MEYQGINREFAPALSYNCRANFRNERLSSWRNRAQMEVIKSKAIQKPFLLPKLEIRHSQLQLWMKSAGDT